MSSAGTIAVIHISDEPKLWSDAGFTIGSDDTCQVGQVCLQLGAHENKTGIFSWSVCSEVHSAGEVSINGLQTKVVAATTATNAPAPAHANGATSIDHLVVFAPNTEAMVNALSDIGLEPRRTRQHFALGQPMRQIFFRMGEVILELVGPDSNDGEGDANFFGLTFTVADLDKTADYLGVHLGRIKEAVQPGRSIATLRKSAGLSTAVAFMTPNP